MRARQIRVATAADLRARLSGPAAVFLSASVPYARDGSQDERNQRYLQRARPTQVRSAVLALTRATLRRGGRLVFGAHPAISPMVLAAARDALGATPHEQGAASRRVVVFQSEYFKAMIPPETLDLSHWDSGVLVWTAARPSRARAPAGPASARSRRERAQSLQQMRELMVRVPGLAAAVFIGGMDGVEEEASIFRAAHPRLPCYALASTGSAASELLARDAKAFRGRLQDERPLTSTRSYPMVARRILDSIPALRSSRS